MLAICLLLGAAALSAEGRVLDCATRGTSEGAVTVRGRYWYTCIEGNFRKDGCLDPEGNRINLNEAYVQNGYEMTCYISEDGRLHIKQSGCVINGERYLPGQTWAGVKFWYTCLRTPDYIVQEVSGCIVDGRRIKENQRAISGRVLYECRIKDTGAIGLCSIGCAVGLRDFLNGESWEDDQFAYQCTNRGGFHVEYLSCIQNGRRFNDGQEWTGDDGVQYRCDILLDGRQGKITRLSYYQ